MNKAVNIASVVDSFVTVLTILYLQEVVEIEMFSLPGLYAGLPRVIKNLSFVFCGFKAFFVSFFFFLRS